MSNAGNKPRWHTNEGYEPPFSSSHLDHSLGEEYLGLSSGTFPTPRRSLSSSGRGSRSLRRVDGARLFNHYRTPSGSLHGGSPNNFIWNPLASSSHRIADSMTAESELAASPSTTVSSAKTEHFFTRAPAIPNKSETTSTSFASKFPSTSYSESILPSQSQAESPFSKPSFLVPGNPARREHYEGRFPPPCPGRMPPMDGHVSFHRSISSRSSSPGGSGSDWSSFQGFMEVGPEEGQEWSRMENVTSPSEYGWGPGQTCIEKITAGCSQPPSPSPSPLSEICGVCSRTLTQRSPWASSRVMGFQECNVVGVLVCGHTYHTECLEQITPHSYRQDPACPRCNPVTSKKPMPSMPTPPRSGTVRGSSFMSRPSPRNKLSRVGALDDSFRKPRFLTSSPEEPSP